MMMIILRQSCPWNGRYVALKPPPEQQTDDGTMIMADDVEITSGVSA